MKSALTAALSTGTSASQQNTQEAASSTTPGITDSYAFPCLLHAKKDKSAVQNGFPKIDFATLKLAGTTPHGSLLANGTAAADYELNPYRRRGGKEQTPGISHSFAESIDKSGGSYAGGSHSLISNAVIGSLPRALSQEQRLEIIRNTPLSPTLSVLKEMGLTVDSKVMARTSEGATLRRHVLRGAVLVFVTAGYSGKRFIFERAKELGVRAVIIDGPDSWSQALETEGVIEKFIPLDFSETDMVFEKCVSAIKKVRAALGEVDGVCTFCEMAVPLVARLAEKFGLPCNSPEAVDNARDKHAARRVMQEAGLPTPKNALINNESELAAAAQAVGFPAVIKPIHGAASIGVVRVNNYEELVKSYARVTLDMKRARINAGALEQGDETDDAGKGNAGSWIQLQIMMEEYLDGPEVDVDVVMSDGDAVYGAITDNWPTVEPYFNETGSNCPSILPQHQQAELLQLAVKSVQSLGATLGVFHVECKYTSRGARLIEVNCRMGGGPVRDTNLLVWGVDLVEEHFLTAVGIPSRPPVSQRPLMHIAEYSINAAKTGIMRNVDFLAKWQNHPDVLYARPLVKAGQKVVCVDDGLPTWVCELMVRKPTVEEAIDFVKSIEQSLEIPIDPITPKQ